MSNANIFDENCTITYSWILPRNKHDTLVWLSKNEHEKIACVFQWLAQMICYFFLIVAVVVVVRLCSDIFDSAYGFERQINGVIDGRSEYWIVIWFVLMLALHCKYTCMHKAAGETVVLLNSPFQLLLLQFFFLQNQKNSLTGPREQNRTDTQTLSKIWKEMCKPRHIKPSIKSCTARK